MKCLESSELHRNHCVVAPHTSPCVNYWICWMLAKSERWTHSHEYKSKFMDVPQLDTARHTITMAWDWLSELFCLHNCSINTLMRKTKHGENCQMRVESGITMNYMWICAWLFRSRKQKCWEDLTMSAFNAILLHHRPMLSNNLRSSLNNNYNL